MTAVIQLLTSIGAGGFLFAPLITANRNTPYNLKAEAIAAGWNQTTKLFAVITVGGGITLSSNTTATPAFDTGVSFPVGSTLALINNGSIIGMGGNGAYENGSVLAGVGGLALRAQSLISITNNNIIAGGGGGGGAGLAQLMGADGNEFYGAGGGGGGGRTGLTNSPAGLGLYGFNGGAGTISGPGAGGAPYVAGTGGGNGGDYGLSGGTTTGSLGAVGGACTSGSASFINWVVNGTRLGTLG